MKIEELTSIGQSIKAFRKKAKLTQTELGEKIGKTESSIRKYEKGLIQAPIDVIEQIASIFGITPYELMGASYWDSKQPDTVNQITGYSAFIKLIEALNFVVEVIPTEGNPDEGITAAEYEISRDKKKVMFTQAEIDELENITREVIEAKFYKKLLEAKK